MDQSDRPPRALQLPLDTVDELPERVDVVVVGGGIAGTSTLHHLAARGVDALLMERERIGSGATSAAVGVLSPPLRQPFHETVHDRGEERASLIWRLACESVKELGDALEAMGEAETVELDRSGGYVLAEPHTAHEIERSFQALDAAGLPVTWLDAAAVRELTGGKGFVGAFRLDGGGALSPSATARVLARDAVARGARVAEDTSVDGVDPEERSMVCRTARGDVRCEMVIYATHVDSRRFSSLLGDEIVPIRGQALAAEVRASSVPPGAFSTHWKLNVWRRTSEGRIHLSGWRHDAWDRAYWKARPGLDPHLQEDLEAWFRAAFPGVDLRVTRRWSGVFGWTADYLPLVGALPGSPRELVVSGFSGGGLPFAYACGRMAADIVRGADPGPEAAMLAPRRFVT